MSERRPKKRPNVFANVVANADEVVAASFIASGPGPGPGPGPGSRETVSKASTTAAAVVDAAPAAPPAGPPASVSPPSASQGQESKPVPAPVVAGAAPDVAEQAPAPPEPAPAPVAPTAAPALAAPAARVAAGSMSEAPVLPLRQPAPAAPELELEPRRAAQVTAPGTDTPSPTNSPVAPASARPAAVPAPEAVPAPAVETAPKVAPRRRQSADARRSTGQTPWSHQAVLESFASATIQSRTWKLHGFRIVPEILTLLKDRINADRRSTGNPKLAISHYLDAVLRHTPTEVDEQIALAQDFLTARMGMVEAGKQSTYRVGPQASEWVSDMNAGLQEADYGRKGIYVVSASIESFLRELDGGGPLQRPELPGR